MRTFFPLLLLVCAAPSFAQEKPRPKPVYRTLDKMLKEYRRQAEAKVVAAR